MEEERDHLFHLLRRHSGARVLIPSSAVPSNNNGSRSFPSRFQTELAQVHSSPCASPQTSDNGSRPTLWTFKILPREKERLEQIVGQVVNYTPPHMQKNFCHFGIHQKVLGGPAFLRSFTDTLVGFVNLHTKYGWDHQVALHLE